MGGNANLLHKVLGDVLQTVQQRVASVGTEFNKGNR